MRRFLIFVHYMVALFEVLSLSMRPFRHHGSGTLLLSTVSPSGMATELSKLGDLLLAGLLTEEEFRTAKAEILGMRSRDRESIASDITQSSLMAAKVLSFEDSGVRDSLHGRFVRIQRNHKKGLSSSLQVMPHVFKAGEKFYGLNDIKTPTLKRELDDFLIFMTESNLNSQESSIRLSTAQVYIRHARLFLGWVVTLYGHESSLPIRDVANNSSISSLSENILLEDLSLHHIFPTTGKESTSIVLNFLKWLRVHRNISHSYESNMLRGLIKLAKFRYARDSAVDPSYGRKPFDDIPMVGELRKLHRDATKSSSKSRRVAEESLKWISWNEYLRVVQSTKEDLGNLMKLFCTFAGCNVSLVDDSQIVTEELRRVMAIVDPELDAQDIWLLTDAEMRKRFREYRNLKIAAPMNEDDFVMLKELLTESDRADGNSRHRKFLKKIAEKFQEYLLLAFFSNIPDRQRTFRELRVGTTFFKASHEEAESLGGYSWLVKHGPDDYKTGNTYGIRPPLVLDSNLTSWIDEYLCRWRQYLNPKCDHFFLQQSTGNAMTDNSIHRLVTKACFEKCGKKTNPHLLRDMIVTHVRGDTNASEQELEALALYMGHSINMQRNSYDRRTLDQKVAPAVSMLHRLTAISSVAD